MPMRGKSNIAASKCRISLKPCEDCILELLLSLLEKFRLSPVPELLTFFSAEKGVCKGVRQITAMIHVKELSSAELPFHRTV